MNSLSHAFDAPLPFDEFRLWAQRIRPPLEAAGIERPCVDVLEYVCTKMLNNVLDHSRATRAQVALHWNERAVVVHIDDDGCGVFASIRTALGLDCDADAALMVVKGKVTTDPQRHTGEGLFFSSRVCEWFNLQSGSTGLSLHGSEGPWTYETPDVSAEGTRLRLRVSRRDAPTLSAVFDRFCPLPELKFTRTIVSVGLMQQSDGSLVSRSQGKRLMMGLERFTSVVLDFGGVGAIQQGFADEVLRVWCEAHPGIEVKVRGDNEQVAGMLSRVGFAR